MEKALSIIDQQRNMRIILCVFALLIGSCNNNITASSFSYPSTWPVSQYSLPSDATQAPWQSGLLDNSKNEYYSVIKPSSKQTFYILGFGSKANWQTVRDSIEKTMANEGYCVYSEEMSYNIIGGKEYVKEYVDNTGRYSVSVYGIMGKEGSYTIEVQDHGFVNAIRVSEYRKLLPDQE